MAAVDGYMSIHPRRLPSAAQIAQCRLISHRGERDNVLIFENTLAAFDPLVDSNVWGIEFDIRWTKDLQPLVFHDPDFIRLFDDPSRVHELTLAEIKRKYPQVPSLEELLERYGKRFHLKIEMKEEIYPDHLKQVQTLKQLLANYEPGIDYHLMSLQPSLLDVFDFVPASAKYPIARWNVQEIAQLVLDKKYPALGGHYFLVPDKTINALVTEKRQLGIGFPDSENNLRRQIQRGCQWLFVNKALRMQAVLDRWQAASADES